MFRSSRLEVLDVPLPVGSGTEDEILSKTTFIYEKPPAYIHRKAGLQLRMRESKVNTNNSPFVVFTCLFCSQKGQGSYCIQKAR